MPLRHVAEGVREVGAIDWDRRLFDELIPLPQGTSYNAYLLEGSERTALIDTVDPRKEGELLGHLDRAGVKQLDYIVSNHAEQDHSGAIPAVLAHYPMARVVTNSRCAELLALHLGIDRGRMLVVKDQERLPLGDLTLRFLEMPWVHWPETMVTYLEERRILFSCDLFGSHLATSRQYASEEDLVMDAAKRYYAEIMMPFRSHIVNHLERLKELEIGTIAPSHGPLWGRPPQILEAYRDWTSERMEDEVVIPYVSMHGTTALMVQRLADALMREGVQVKPFNLTVTDTGELAEALVGAATIVLGTPTVLTGPHPLAFQAAYLVSVLKPKARYASLIGSYGWGGKTAKVIQELVAAGGRELIAPVLVRGLPNAKALEALDGLAAAIAERHRRDPRIRRGSA